MVSAAVAMTVDLGKIVPAAAVLVVSTVAAMAMHVPTMIVVFAVAALFVAMFDYMAFRIFSGVSVVGSRAFARLVVNARAGVVGPVVVASVSLPRLVNRGVTRCSCVTSTCVGIVVGCSRCGCAASIVAGAVGSSGFGCVDVAVL